MMEKEELLSERSMETVEEKDERTEGTQFF